MEAALLQQKVEFLEMEIEEIRRREENLKKINSSLMHALNNEPNFNDQILAGVQNNSLGLAAEISSLKKKHKAEVAVLEKQIQELFLSKKELQIDLKHQKTAQESEKYEFLSVVKQLETEKIQLEKALRKLEESDFVLQDRNFKENPRLSFDNKSSDSRFVLKENEQFKSKIEYLNAKLKNKKEKIKRLKERTNEKALRVRIEEIEGELETYKILSKKQSSSVRPSEIEKTLRKDLEDAQATIANLKNKNDSKSLVMKKDSEIQQLKEKLVKSLVETERLNGELGRLNLKLQQNDMYWKMSDQKRSETELALKNEIKFLIGKLLKAKSKLGDDAKEVTSKRGLVTTVRSQSVKKDLKVIKGVSLLDLSSITRSDSPFCVSNLEI